jgi:dTDP-glucose 4,6-dehydratase
LNTFVLKFPEIRFINIDSITYAGDLSRIDEHIQSSSNYLFEKTDIRDKDTVREIYKKYNPTGTIHFAAETHVDRSIS